MRDAFQDPNHNDVNNVDDDLHLTDPSLDDKESTFDSGSIYESDDDDLYEEEEQESPELRKSTGDEVFDSPFCTVVRIIDFFAEIECSSRDFRPFRPISLNQRNRMEKIEGSHEKKEG